MKQQPRNDSDSQLRLIIKWGLLSLLLISCAGLDPRNVDVELQTEPPAPKVTSFDQALSDLGQMSLIYGCDLLNIMLYGGQDYTGTSAHTGGEIPGDIMEMIKSVLNSIGGNVYYIPYTPGLIDTVVRLGWTSYEGKQIPHVVLTGGITEFDRGISTRGKNEDLSVETQPFTNAPKWTPGDTIGIEYANGAKESLARITLDFNLTDFQKNMGIPKMQTVNSIHVHKATVERELAITLFGPTFGLKGTIKKVEGRHAAVRLLVQLSMIQIVGKYFDLPYWNLLPGAKPDPVVLETVARDFSEMDSLVRAIKTQELLYLIGYDVAVTGLFDEQTRAALRHFDQNSCPAETDIDADTYLRLYCAVPVSHEALQRRYLFNQMLDQFIASLKQAEAPPPSDETPQDAPEKPSEKNAEPASDKKTGKKKKSRLAPQPDPPETKSDETLVLDLIELLENKAGRTSGDAVDEKTPDRKEQGDKPVKTDEW